MRKLIGVTLVMVVITVLAACNQEDETTQKEHVIPVETAKVEKGDLVVEKMLYGRTKPTSATPVTIQNPGEVTELNVENGDMVDEDDHIATVKTAAGSQAIYAPKSGEIAQLTATENAMAGNSDPLAVIIDNNEMKLTFAVTADTLDLLKKGDTYTAVINENKYDAEITSVGTMPDDTGLYPVEATVENKEETIITGMIAALEVPEKKVNDTLIVLTDAVVNESGETFVYIVKDNKAVKKDVTVKEVKSDKTAIEGDVKKGDAVVTNGQLTLEDGSKVETEKEGGKS